MKYYKVKEIKATAPNSFHVIDTGSNVTHSMHSDFEAAQAKRRQLQHDSRRESLMKCQAVATAAAALKAKSI